MTVGRKPKPTLLKELAGNPGKRALNKNEPKPTGIPTCPSHLSAAAKREWTRISRELIAIGLLTSVDRAALAAYCSAYSRWAEAEKQIQKFGQVFKSPKSGFPIVNPYVGTANKALELMHKFSVEFGMTPASRTRLSVDSNSTPEGDLESFMGELTGNVLNDSDSPTIN